jgi:hypothetical protein
MTDVTIDKFETISGGVYLSSLPNKPMGECAFRV